MTRRHVTPTREWGSPEHPPLLLLHGFTGSGAFWAPLAEGVADRWHVVAPDLPGHGAADLPAPGTGLPEAAEAIAQSLDAPATVVGYSLGGRLALHLAIAHPEKVSRLILIGASAGLETESERAERRQADARWAAMLRTEGLDAFLDAWEALPLFAGHADAPEARRAWLRELRADQSAEGLAASLEAFGLGAQASLHEAITTLNIPTTWVVGERDAKFTAIANALAPRMPNARVHSVPACGHNVPFERPDALSALIDEVSAVPLAGGRV